MQSWISQLRKGVTEMVVLAALRPGEAYGYELLRRINDIEGLALTESQVYPLLARLAGDQFVRVRTAPSPTGPPRRYYQLTTAGRRHLSEMIQSWRQIGTAVDHLLKENQNGRSAKNVAG